MAEFRKGDIVRNIFAGKNNPTAYLLYLGKGTCRQGRYSYKVYNCIGYDGTKVQIFRKNPFVDHNTEPNYCPNCGARASVLPVKHKAKKTLA